MKLFFVLFFVCISIVIHTFYDLIFGVLYMVFGGSGSYSCTGVSSGHNVIDEW